MQRSLSTFQTFAKGQENSTFLSESLPRPRHRDSGPPTLSLAQKKNEQSNRDGNGKGSGNGIFSETFPRRGGGMSKGKAVSVPLIPLSYGNMAASPLTPPRHGQSQSLIEDSRNDLSPSTTHSHSHSNSLSIASADSNGENNGWSLDSYFPNNDDVSF